MKVSVITSTYVQSYGKVAVFKGALTAAQIHQIAEAFIRGARTPLRKRLQHVFGRHMYRRYCCDFTGGHRCRVTFSMTLKPEVLERNGSPVSIAPLHSPFFELLIMEVDLEQLGGATVTSTPFHVGE